MIYYLFIAICLLKFREGYKRRSIALGVLYFYLCTVSNIFGIYNTYTD